METIICIKGKGEQQIKYYMQNLFAVSPSLCAASLLRDKAFWSGIFSLVSSIAPWTKTQTRYFGGYYQENPF